MSTRFESLVLSDRTLDKYQANGLKMLEPGASMFLTSVYPNAGFATVFTVTTIVSTTSLPPTSVLEVLQHSTCNSCLGFPVSKVWAWISWSIFSEIVNDAMMDHLGYSMPTKTHQPTSRL